VTAVAIDGSINDDNDNNYDNDDDDNDFDEKGG